MAYRRQFLAATGMLASGARIVSADTDSEVAAEEIGLADKISELLARGRIQQAQELMDKHDVQYSIAHGSVGGQDDSSGGISPERVYKNVADVHCSLVKLSEEDRWLATGVAEHNGDGKLSLRDHATVADGSILYWDNSHWTSANPTSDNVTLWANGRHSISSDKYRATGTSAKVDLFDGGTKPFTVSHHTELYKSYSGTHVPVAYEYVHTRAASALGSISIGFGPLSVSVNNGKVSWREDASASP